MCVHQSRMLPREVARKCGARPDVRKPINLTGSRIECFGVVCLELRKFEEYAIGGARPKAGTVGRLKGAAKAHVGGMLVNFGGVKCCELASQQLAKPTRLA